MDRSVGAERQRVDGEVAPTRVGGEVAPERDLGPPPVGLDVLAQRRRFERAPVDDDRHRAMRNAGQGDLEPGLARAADDFVGRRGGREVEIDRRLAEREIPHGAADESGLLAPSVERFERSRERALPEGPQILEPSMRRDPEGRSFEAPRDQHAIFDMRRDVNAAAPRRERVDGDEAEHRRRQADERHHRDPPAGPVFNLERVAGPQQEIERIDRERA